MRHKLCGSFFFAEFVANTFLSASVIFSDLLLTYSWDTSRNAFKPSWLVFVIVIKLEPKLTCITNSSKTLPAAKLKRINLAVLELGHPFKCTDMTQIRGVFLRLVIRNALKTTQENTLTNQILWNQHLSPGQSSLSFFGLAKETKRFLCFIRRISIVRNQSEKWLDLSPS